MGVTASAFEVVPYNGAARTAIVWRNGRVKSLGRQARICGHPRRCHDGRGLYGINRDIGDCKYYCIDLLGTSERLTAVLIRLNGSSEAEPEVWLCVWELQEENP